ncbi:hypothetical protein DL771_007368 [Monosporascus sp. 5C6A]|nr:hypothetical protein DL771_007368 [Monosporascus sp. 5C6A]
MDLASLYFGLFLGVFVFTFAKVLQQTRVGLWAIQTQLLPQIIANRVSLIMTNKRKIKKLKWSLVIAIGCINITVCYIWTTAQMPSATPYQIKVNHMFEIAEKSIFLVVDLGLNLYFLYLVRFRLIADGLSKYWRLFNFNAGIVVLSTSMDILLLGFLGLPNPYLYVQFAPLAYIVKLYIELLMAVLISKVVRSGAAGRGDGYYGSSGHKSNPTHHMTSHVVISGSPPEPKSGNTFLSKLGKDVPARKGSTGSEIHLTTYPGQHGITKTVETRIEVNDGKDGHSAKS